MFQFQRHQVDVFCLSLPSHDYQRSNLDKHNLETRTAMNDIIAHD